MMPITEVIKELADLLAEQERIEQKIRETQTALSDIKKRISESLVHHYMAMSGEKVSLPQELIQEEQSQEYLLHALLDMKNDIAKRIRPVENQIVQSNTDSLKQIFDQEKNHLSHCLDGIDQNILDCGLHVQEYEKTRSSLKSLNERLLRLGNEAHAVPDPLPTNDLGDIVVQRITYLRSQGKI
jgi:hypothetical protein